MLSTDPNRVNVTINSVSETYALTLIKTDELLLTYVLKLIYKVEIFISLIIDQLLRLAIIDGSAGAANTLESRLQFQNKRPAASQGLGRSPRGGIQKRSNSSKCVTFEFLLLFLKLISN